MPVSIVSSINSNFNREGFFMRLFLHRGWELLLLAALVALVSRPAVARTWECGDASNPKGAAGVVATLNDGTLTINGSGSMTGYNVRRQAETDDYTIWGAARDSIVNVVIENGVTSVGYGSFAGCGALTTVAVGAGVTSIGGYAFANCPVLASVAIFGRLDSLGTGAFQNCGALVSVISLSRTAPAVSGGGAAVVDPFYGVNKSSACVFVPKSSIPAYKAANFWKEFACIRADEELVPAGLRENAAPAPAPAPATAPAPEQVAPSPAAPVVIETPSAPPADSVGSRPDSANLSGQAAAEAKKAVLSIYDVSGKLIDKIAVNDESIGGVDKRRLAGKWDLRDSEGRLVFNGTYAARGAVTSYGGFGLHWGFDFSMNMKNGNDVMSGDFDLSHFGSYPLPKKIGSHDHDPDDPYDPDDPGDPGDPSDPGDMPDLLIKDAPYLKMSRSDWKRSALNFGGKIFVDVIPYVETIELSFNLGVWQYNSVAYYLDVDAIDVDAASGVFKLPEAKDLPYDSIPLTLKEYDMNYFGLNGTPYAKLQLDASVRKTVYEWWRVKFNAGAGLSVHFATPLLNVGLIEAVQKDEGIETAEELVKRFMDDADGIGEKILEKFLEESFSPRFGAHIAAGARLNLSLIGLYVDGKLLIPLSKYDENRQVRSLGILLNTGLYFPF
jgi:hypothetical protein